MLSDAPPLKSVLVCLAAGAGLLIPLPTAAQAVFPKAENCQLRAPPQGAPIASTHGVVLRQFPARSAISTEYSGCQSVWLADGHLLSRAHFKHGALKDVWAFEPDKKGLHCRYSAGVVVSPATPDSCPAASELPFNVEARAQK